MGGLPLEIETSLKIELIGAGGFGDTAPCAVALDPRPFGIADLIGAPGLGAGFES